MKKIEFTVHGEPRVGGTVDVEGIVTSDDGTPIPNAIPIRYDDHLIHMPATEGVVALHVAFETEAIVTIAPGDDYEGEPLVLHAMHAA